MTPYFKKVFQKVTSDEVNRLALNFWVDIFLNCQVFLEFAKGREGVLKGLKGGTGNPVGVLFLELEGRFGIAPLQNPTIKFWRSKNHADLALNQSQTIGETPTFPKKRP